MKELPKIVRTRLGREARQNAEALRAGSHPDANLLSAFIEHALSERERTTVLTHLADCAQCRELVALAFPTPDVQAAFEERPDSNRAQSPRWLGWPQWLPWSALRWGVLAASVGIVMVGAFRTGILKWPAAQNTARTTVAENRRASSVLAPSSAAGPPPAAVAPTELAESKGATRMADSLKPAEAPRMTARYRAESSTLPKQRASALAGGAASHAEEADKVAALEVPKVAPAKDARAVAAKEPSANPNEGQPGTTNQVSAPANSPGAAGGAFKIAPARRDLDNKSLARTQEAQVQAAPAAREKKANEQALENALGQAMAPPPQSSTAQQSDEERPASGLVPRSGTQGVAGTRQKAARGAGRQRLQLQQAALKAYWSISASGRLERSAASGGPWTELSIDDTVSFRAVTADGADVWAGGSRGALYHSTDGGEHWARIQVARNQGVGQAAVTDTIVGIRFTDREHGTVTTDSHETWVTADGGQHWTIGPRSR